MASRHSSSDTAVNSDANEKESIKSHASRMYANLPSTLPSDIQRADQQLHVLTQCIQSMDQEMQHLREEQGTSEALERIRQRLDALESRVTKHSAMLEEQRRMILDQRQTRMDREGTSAGEAPGAPVAASPLPRTKSATPTRPVFDANRNASSPTREAADTGRTAHPVPSYTPAPTSASTAIPTSPTVPAATFSTSTAPAASRTGSMRTVETVVKRMYDELQRLARAIDGMYCQPQPEPPLTPPHDVDSPKQVSSLSTDEPPDSACSAQERYEKICQTVADALGIPSPPGKTSSSSLSRKERIRANLRQREADDAATESLLSRLHHTKSPLLSMSEVRMLEHLFEQHRREFLHQKQLYCELADELKCMEPSMDATKRRILAEHVHESIESLEAEATRINGLHAHLVRHGRATLV